MKHRRDKCAKTCSKTPCSKTSCSITPQNLFDNFCAELATNNSQFPEQRFSSSVFLTRYQEENHHEKDRAWSCCSSGHLHRRAGNGADWLLRRPRRGRRWRRRAGTVLSLRLRLSV